MKEIITTHFFNNKKKYLTLIGFLLIGIIVGGILVYILNEDQITELVSYIQGFFKTLTKDNALINNNEIFTKTLYTDIKIFFFLWLFGFTSLGTYYCIGAVTFKGFLFGFTNTFLIEEFGFKGLIFSLIGLIPQNIIKIGILIFASVIVLTSKENAGVSKGRIKKKSNFRMYIAYTLILLICFILNIVGIYLESYITPLFISVFSPNLI